MKVGVSMIQLAAQRSTGLERYAVQLINALLEHAPADIEVVPYVPAWAAPLVAGPARVAPPSWPRPLANEVWLPVRAKQDRLDLLHECGMAPPALLRRGATMTLHDTVLWDLPGSRSRGARWYFTPALNRALGARRPVRGVVTDAQFTLDRCRELFDLKAPGIVAPLGVDGRWTPAGPPPAGPPYQLLTVGTLEPRKGLAQLQHTAAELASRGVEFEWRVVGRPGWSFEPPQGVTLVGAVDDAQLLSEYRAAHVLVSPSQFEGFGLPVLEALACGTPVVATDIAAHREHFAAAARLVPYGDSCAMADAIVAALGSPDTDRACRLAHAATFTWERTARHVISLWRAVLEAPDAA